MEKPTAEMLNKIALATDKLPKLKSKVENALEEVKTAKNNLSKDKGNKALLLKLEEAERKHMNASNTHSTLSSALINFKRIIELAGTEYINNCKAAEVTYDQIIANFI